MSEGEYDMNKTFKYILLTPIHIMFRDFISLFVKLFCRYPKASTFTAFVMIVLSYLSTPNLFAKEIDVNENLLWYPYWNNIDTTQKLQALQRYANQCIIKKENYNLIDIFNKLDDEQSIYISQNRIDDSIYIITNKYNYIIDLFIYRKNNNQYNLDKHIWFLHFYKIGDADFDETNNEIYLGVLAWAPNEGNLKNHDIKGYSRISFSNWEKINNIIK